MRLFSPFALRTAQTLALLLLALTLARPASSQTTAANDTIQVIGQQQKVISQTYKLERAGESVMYLESLALLAAYGGWSRYDSTGGGVRLENTKFIETVERLNPILIKQRKQCSETKACLRTN